MAYRLDQYVQRFFDAAPPCASVVQAWRPAKTLWPLFDTGTTANVTVLLMMGRVNCVETICRETRRVEVKGVGSGGLDPTIEHH
jgi:hypothetical protein